MNTIDLDHITEKKLHNIINDIKDKTCCMRLDYRKSTSTTGYHIRIMCDTNIECIECRIKYDDINRLNSDINFRPEKHQNVLFQVKSFYCPNFKRFVEASAEEWRHIK